MKHKGKPAWRIRLILVGLIVALLLLLIRLSIPQTPDVVYRWVQRPDYTGYACQYPGNPKWYLCHQTIEIELDGDGGE